MPPPHSPDDPTSGPEPPHASPGSTSTGTGRDGALDLALRREVGALRRSHPRRRFCPALHLGELAGERSVFSVEAPDLTTIVDAQLRTDVVALLLDEAPPASRPESCPESLPEPRPESLRVWLTRPGVPEPEDGDLAWFAATRMAFGQQGLVPGTFHVVTRSGWLDLRTGRSRSWRRLRL